jgi:DnaK suppressor protein
MDAMQQQAMSIAAERRRQLRLKRIETALRRIDQGEFGYCVHCGEEIPEARLSVDPTSPSCINCAAAQ